MKVERPGYVIAFKPNGLFGLTVGDVEVIDRGGLNEFLDLRDWRNPSAMIDGQPTIAGRGENASDRYRRAYHYLQVWNDAVVNVRGGEITVSGELTKESGAGGAMEFRMLYECGSYQIRLKVWRRYLADFEAVGDDSLCFLSPAGYARRFVGFAPEGIYQSRNDDQTVYRERLAGAGQTCQTHVPDRLKTRTAKDGWAALMGDRAGFGVVVLGYGPGTDGEIRCTRPRPPAHYKFDEIEFQWRMGGARKAGDVETAEMIIVPCQSARDVQQVYEAERLKCE